MESGPTEPAILARPSGVGPLGPAKWSTLFGTQVSNPIKERSPTESQAGRATQPKNIMADTGFAGQHTYYSDRQLPPGYDPGADSCEASTAGSVAHGH
jgi:hypothetical protein